MSNMNQMPSVQDLAPVWQPSTSSSAAQAGFTFLRTDVAVTAGGARRFVSIVLSVAIQAAFVAGIMSAMGVKLPHRVEPLTVINIIPDQQVEQDIAPLPVRLVQPEVKMTVPVMPEVAIDLPPPVNTPTNALTVATVGTPPAEYHRPAAEPYESVMLNYIIRHMRYPAIARARHQEGTAYVRVVMDRRGYVLSSALAKTSRAQALDDEALDLMQRAQPLPAPPDSVTGDRIEFVIPVAFKLNQ